MMGHQRDDIMRKSYAPQVWQNSIFPTLPPPTTQRRLCCGEKKFLRLLAPPPLVVKLITYLKKNEFAKLEGAQLFDIISLRAHPIAAV